MKHLSGKEKKELKGILPKGYEIDKKDEIIIDNNEVVLKDNNPFLIFKDNSYLPHLKSIDSEFFPCVYIDKGAIPFLMKGADMMRPGIQKIEGEFEKGDIVIVKDENYEKNLGLGYSKLNSVEMKNETSGKVIEIFHYVNDQYY